MRPLLMADLLALARVIEASRPEDRSAKVRRILADADAADHARRAGLAVAPGLGDGTVEARCAREHAPALPVPLDLNALRSLGQAAETLARAIFTMADARHDRR
jgi:hypothetical protein